MAPIILTDITATQRFGALLAHCITLCGPTAIFLHGHLGSGKTALTRSMVEALPGGDAAEPASPSFTLCNRYPTRPEVLHCDLYRCQANIPDELLDALDDTRMLVVTEWGEYLPASELPQDYLDITLQACEKQRLLTLQACGPVATALQNMLLNMWSAKNA